MGQRRTRQFSQVMKDTTKEVEQRWQETEKERFVGGEGGDNINKTMKLNIKI
jgi:hypothetical protein